MNDVTDQTLRHVLPFGKEYRKKSVPGKKTTNKKQVAIWINIANT